MHIAVAYDLYTGVARLYLNGARINTQVAVTPLTLLPDVNNWLGKSQYRDPFFAGSFDEFRIYDGPLSDSEIAADFTAGPDKLPEVSVPAPTLSAKLENGKVVLRWPSTATGFGLEGAPSIGGTWAAINAAPLPDGNQLKVEMAPGTVSFFRLRK